MHARTGFGASSTYDGSSDELIRNLIQGRSQTRRGRLKTTSRVEAFRSGLRNLGYVEGENIAIEFRWAEEKYDQLSRLAAELIRLKVDVLVTYGTPGSLVAKSATTTIPIVMAHSGDAVAAGIVTSLARPGGNLTGMTYFLRVNHRTSLYCSALVRF